MQAIRSPPLALNPIPYPQGGTMTELKTQKTMAMLSKHFAQRRE